MAQVSFIGKIFIGVQTLSFCVSNLFCWYWMCAKPNYDVRRNIGEQEGLCVVQVPLPQSMSFLGLVESLLSFHAMQRTWILFSNCSTMCMLVKKLSTYTWWYLCFKSLVSLHHVCTQPYFLVLLSARVDLKMAEAAAGTILQYQHFDTMLDCLHCHVLL